jgi:hypothetical protein
VTWVSGLSWTNLHVLQEDGVFEKYRREFDVNSVLQTQSDSQHSTAWVRTDRQSVTVRYIGGASNANKSVQFLPGGDIDFTDSTGGSGRGLPSATRDEVQRVARPATIAFFDLHLKHVAATSSPISAAALEPLLAGEIDRVEVLSK